MKALLPLQTQPAAVPSREVGQDNSKQLKPEQPKQRQRRLFLQATSEDESEPVKVSIIAKHASVPVQNPAKQRQAAVPKQQQQQQPAKVQGQQAQRARPVSVHEDKAQEVEDDDVPATYNNMPVKHKQSSQQASDDDDASHEEADAQEVSQASSQQKRKRGHQKQQPAQVVGKDLDFAASDAESDEYEPTQAKAAAKAAALAAAKKATDKAAQPKGAKSKPRQPKQDKQQGTFKQPHNVAEATAAEGPAKRPRGRPRKAPQEQQLCQQASKRKAAEVAHEEEEGSDEEVLPIKAAVIKAAVKPKAKQGGRLKRAALMSEANEDAPFHVNCCTLDHSSATATRFTLHSFPACSHQCYDSLVNL